MMRQSFIAGMLVSIAVALQTFLTSGPSATVAAAEFEPAAFEPGQIDARSLTALVAKSRVVLVDVRTAEEFAVSRIKGAVRADQTTEQDVLIRRLGARIPGAVVVLYCTLGPRSVGFGINAQDALTTAGAKAVLTLTGGLIAWVNAGLPLVDAKGPTRFVHPSDQATSQHLSDPTRARFEPRR